MSAPHTPIDGHECPTLPPPYVDECPHPLWNVLSSSDEQDKLYSERIRVMVFVFTLVDKPDINIWVTVNQFVRKKGFNITNEIEGQGHWAQN